MPGTPGTRPLDEVGASRSNSVGATNPPLDKGGMAIAQLGETSVLFAERWIRDGKCGCPATKSVPSSEKRTLSAAKGKSMVWARLVRVFVTGSRSYNLTWAREEEATARVDPSGERVTPLANGTKGTGREMLRIMGWASGERVTCRT